MKLMREYEEINAVNSVRNKKGIKANYFLKRTSERTEISARQAERETDGKE